MIELQHLGKTYGDVSAIEDVSFEIAAGETFAFLGPNGSGKTTTLKCIAGLVRPSAGHVAVAAPRAEISYLPQRVAFSENLTAGEVLDFYRRLRKLPRARLDAVLEICGLEGVRGRLVGELSGGMVQRLGIAVALLPEARVLLLDEPTASLDPEGAVVLRRLLESFRGTTTIVFSSHVLADVELLAGRVAIFVAGRLAAVETPAALRARVAGASLEEVYLRYVNGKNHSGADAADDGLPEPAGAAGRDRAR